MHTLYDSDSFCVNHMLANAPEMAPREADAGHASDRELAPAIPAMPRHGFEIIDKRSGKEIYLDGSWAEMFQQQILAWQREAPTEEEVDATLDGYTGLAQQPLVVH